MKDEPGRHDELSLHTIIHSLPPSHSNASSCYCRKTMPPSTTSKLSSLFPPGVRWQQGGAVARLRHRQRCYLLPPYTCLTVPRFVLSLAPRSSQHRARRIYSPYHCRVILPPCGALLRGCRGTAESTRLLTGHCFVHPYSPYHTLSCSG